MGWDCGIVERELKFYERNELGLYWTSENLRRKSRGALT